MHLRLALLYSICAICAICLGLVGCAGESSSVTSGSSPSMETSFFETRDEKEQDNTDNSSGTVGASQNAEGRDGEQANSVIEAIDPRALSVGTRLTADQIERAGGERAFFWNEPIPDEVFARMEGKSFGADCTLARDDLRYVRVLHADAEGGTLVGELVVNQLVAQEVEDIFRELYDARFAIKKMHLVDDYDAVDEDSCADDNTSAFNYRVIAGTTTLSNHAWGLAIDINTYENPYFVESTGHVWPPDATRYLDRTLADPYMIRPGDACYEAFVSRGWQWGGEWSNVHDYQHFEKPSVLQN